MAADARYQFVEIGVQRFPTAERDYVRAESRKKIDARRSIAAVGTGLETLTYSLQRRTGIVSKDGMMALAKAVRRLGNRRERSSRPHWDFIL